MSVVYSNTSDVEIETALPGFDAIKRYWDRHQNAIVARILPGEFYVTKHDEAVTTVLGSCVSACVRDRIYKIGGMNHFMLPVSMREPGDVSPRGPSNSAIYGNYAMESLINAILTNGGRRENLEVKLVGGGRVLTEMNNIGRLNIAFIRDYVETEHLNLLAEDLGSTFPRKVAYFPATGRLRVKKMAGMHNKEIVTREEKYKKTIEKQEVKTDIELF